MKIKNGKKNDVIIMELRRWIGNKKGNFKQFGSGIN